MAKKLSQYIINIQNDSPDMITIIFFFNNEIIEILIFRIFNYAQRPIFQIIEFFVLLIRYTRTVAGTIQATVFQIRTLSFNVNYLVNNNIFENIDT